MLKLEKESIAVLSGKEMSQVNGGSIKSFFKKLFTKARYCLNGGGDVPVDKSMIVNPRDMVDNCP